ncbi:MAG: YaeQ family protein [Bacteriovorax sp.]|nr:YaeQ family protein [Bacteriovorax sp.]
MMLIGKKIHKDYNWDNLNRCKCNAKIFAMALKSTIHKVRLTLSNLDIHHYNDYSLTIAKHPSENDLRMMIRILAFSLSAQEEIQFTKGLSTDTEPDLWKINHDGSIDHWIELGLPDERQIRQMCSKANKVTIYTYHGNQALQWFESVEGKVHRFDHLNIIHFTVEEGKSLEALVDKGMNLDISIEDNEIWISNDTERMCVQLQIVRSSKSL